jgi:hypothetical protein
MVRTRNYVANEGGAYGHCHGASPEMMADRRALNRPQAAQQEVVRDILAAVGNASRGNFQAASL